MGIGARNGDFAGFQRLAQRIEHGALEFRQGEAGAFDPGDVRHVRKIEFEPPCVVDLRQQADFEEAGGIEQEIARAELRQARLERGERAEVDDLIAGMASGKPAVSSLEAASRVMAAVAACQLSARRGGIQIPLPPAMAKI